MVLDKNDVDIWFTRGSGPGGQHKNKVETCCYIYHRLSGIKVKNEDSRSKLKNEQAAWKELESRLLNIHESKEKEDENNKRKSQIGLGGRSQKKRTYKINDDLVIDHMSGKRASYKQISKGNFDLLH